FAEIVAPNAQSAHALLGFAQRRPLASPAERFRVQDGAWPQCPAFRRANTALEQDVGYAIAGTETRKRFARIELDLDGTLQCLERQLVADVHQQRRVQRE